MTKESQVLCADANIHSEPPCDACGEPFDTVDAIETPLYDDEDRQIVVAVSLCTTCKDVDALVVYAAENVLVRMGAITRHVDPKEAN